MIKQFLRTQWPAWLLVAVCIMTWAAPIALFGFYGVLFYVAWQRAQARRRADELAMARAEYFGRWDIDNRWLPNDVKAWLGEDKPLLGDYGGERRRLDPKQRFPVET